MISLKVVEGGFSQQDEDDLVNDVLKGAIPAEEFERRVKLLQPKDESKQADLNLVP